MRFTNENDEKFVKKLSNTKLIMGFFSIMIGALSAILLNKLLFLYNSIVLGFEIFILFFIHYINHERKLKNEFSDRFTKNVQICDEMNTAMEADNLVQQANKEAR